MHQPLLHRFRILGKGQPAVLSSNSPGQPEETDSGGHVREIRIKVMSIGNIVGNLLGMGILRGDGTKLGILRR